MILQSHSWAYIHTKPFIWEDTLTPVIIGDLFTIDETWKQPKCPLIDEWITHTHTHSHTNTHTVLLSHKKEWNCAICSSIDRPREYHTKWSKPEKDKYRIIYMWNLKYDTNEFICKREIDSQTQKTNSWLPKGKWGR